MSKLSVVIITYNEEKNISRCLNSVKDIADEVIVLDSFSEDGTEEICKKYGVRFIKRKWEGYSKSKNYANQLAQYDYILSIDADEALSDELKTNILTHKNMGLRGVYEFNRLTNYCGKWIHHCGWYPDRKVRLFPKEKAQWKGDYVHEELTFENNGKKIFIKGDLLHYSYYTTSEHKARIEKYSVLAARKLLVKGGEVFFMQRFFSPLLKFLKMYFFQLGFLDGYYGFVISVISARARFLKYRKLEELRKENKIN